MLPGRRLPAPYTDETDNVLLELTAAMRPHGRGGLVLVVPPGSAQWQMSIVQPLSYPLAPAYIGIRAVQRPGQSKRE